MEFGCPTLGGVASSSAFQEPEGILIALGIDPSGFADSCHMLGYRSYSWSVLSVSSTLGHQRNAIPGDL